MDPWMAFGIGCLLGSFTTLVGASLGLRDRNETIYRHRARSIRKARGDLFWWLLLPGWRYRR